ncbi:MAG TPA: helix-turn-helix domain-containing protein [Longimicrobiaceae bacterium]|nr:helix-turn-helix domain-containing protein [Longimicrobiaceae bacterium]
MRRIVREELAQAKPANEPAIEYMRTRQVAEMLGCSAREVQRMAGKGLPHVKVGAEYRFRRADVEAYLKGGGE